MTDLPLSNQTSLDTETDCQDFVEGCLFMGTGGGGSREDGLTALQSGLKDGLNLGWVDPNTIDDDALTVTAYASGSIAPKDPATIELIESLRLGTPQPIQDAITEAIEELGSYLGASVGAVVPIELGASNSPTPIVAAARLGIPVPDGDYTGRAAPDEMQGTPFIYGLDSDPFTSVDPWGNIAIVRQTTNPYMLERVSKMLSIAGIDGTGIASTPLKGSEMKRILVPGTLSRSLAIGRAARKASEEGDDPVEATVEAAQGWRLFDGVVTEKEWEDRDGYMFGELRIEGSRPSQRVKSDLRVWFKNENHVTWLDGEPWVCSPDLVSIVVASSGRGITSTNIAVGDQVSVVGMRGLDVFRTDEALINAAGPPYFGFPDITYRPIEQIV